MKYFKGESFFGDAVPLMKALNQAGNVIDDVYQGIKSWEKDQKIGKMTYFEHLKSTDKKNKEKVK